MTRITKHKGCEFTAINWTAEERAAMAAADAEIDAMPVSSEEVAESNRRDALARRLRMDNKRYKVADYQRRYREANKDKVADYQRRYYEANKDKIRNYKREYMRAYRLAKKQE